MSCPTTSFVPPTLSLIAFSSLSFILTTRPPSVQSFSSIRSIFFFKILPSIRSSLMLCVAVSSFLFEKKTYLSQSNLYQLKFSHTKKLTFIIIQSITIPNIMFNDMLLSYIFTINAFILPTPLTTSSDMSATDLIASTSQPSMYGTFPQKQFD